MIPTQRALHTFVLLALCAACSRTPEPPREAPLADPVPPGIKTRFGGELSLRGPLANLDEGAIFVAIFPMGATSRDRKPLLLRTYLLADPEWRRSAGARSLRFDLGVEDSFDDKPPRLSREMNLVVHFDPDGNSATREPGEREVSTRARVGDTDLSIVFDSAADVPRAAKSDER